MMLLALISVIACSLAARGFQLQSRTVQPSALCSSDFSWADNLEDQSPCMVAAYVAAPCNQNDWVLPALDGSDHYTPPSGSGAGTPLTACTCSWASYNLISACTDCQGFSNLTISWSAYSFNCAGRPGLLSNTYFPTNITLIENTQIPFWATTNPTSWPGAQFDSSAAQNIRNKGHSDVGSPTSSTTASSTTTSSTTTSSTTTSSAATSLTTTSSTTTSSATTSSTTTTTQSNPIGAIVGGVVGGVVVLLCVIILGIYLFRRTSRPNNVTDPSPLLMNETYSRSLWDNNNGYAGYTSLSSPPIRCSSPTIRTHLTSASTSIRSFPFFSSGGSTFSHSMGQQSPPPYSVAIQRDETAVELFRFSPTNNYNPNRKRADGVYPVYDPPTARPTVRMGVQSTAQTPRGRTKYNISARDIA